MKTRHKYHAIQKKVDGISFASKKEAKRYEDLKLLQRSGEVVFFLRQTPFHLPGNTKYVCDFTIFWSDGRVTFNEVKGYRTQNYLLKRKLVESLYPIKIEET